VVAVKKKESPSFARVWILIPRAFLEHFDREIEEMFPPGAKPSGGG